MITFLVRHNASPMMIFFTLGGGRYKKYGAEGRKQKRGKTKEERGKRERRGWEFSVLLNQPLWEQAAGSLISTSQVSWIL